jgi:hypothetical protein
LIDGRARGNSSLTVSSLRRTVADYIFTTPSIEEGPSGKHRLFYFYKRKLGISVVKQNGSYRINRYPLDPSVEVYEEFYIGGHKHTVNDSIKSGLIAANIGVTEANFVAI